MMYPTNAFKLLHNVYQPTAILVTHTSNIITKCG